MKNTDLISELLDFKNKEKFSDAEWEERGLNPSSDSVIQDMKTSVNVFIDELIEKLQDKSENPDLEDTFIQSLNQFDLENYDTEEREFIIDNLHQVSNICNLKVPNELNKLLYGEIIADLIKETEFKESESKKFCSEL